MKNATFSAIGMVCLPISGTTANSMKFEINIRMGQKMAIQRG